MFCSIAFMCALYLVGWGAFNQNLRDVNQLEVKQNRAGRCTEMYSITRSTSQPIGRHENASCEGSRRSWSP